MTSRSFSNWAEALESTLSLVIGSQVETWEKFLANMPVIPLPNCLAQNGKRSILFQVLGERRGQAGKGLPQLLT